MLKERLNIYALKDDVKKMKYLFKVGNDAIITGINGRNLVKLKNINIDMLGGNKLNL